MKDNTNDKAGVVSGFAAEFGLGCTADQGETNQGMSRGLKSFIYIFNAFKPNKEKDTNYLNSDSSSIQGTPKLLRDVSKKNGKMWEF